MKALLLERSLPRWAAARVTGSVGAGRGTGMAPLRLVDMAPPALPGPGWQRVQIGLAGICGSDLATLEGHSSRYFEPLVSFPFVPGHEVVGVVAGAAGEKAGGRVVVEPVLGCAARGIDPPCPACAEGRTGGCERTTFGRLRPGLQTGYCADTGGGWSAGLVAHASQLHAVPDDLDDAAAVMVEPAACAVHAALAAAVSPGDRVAVLGAGTLGLCAVAALRHLALPGTILAGAKYPHQRRLASDLGADVVAGPDEVRRAVRRLTRSMAVGRPGRSGQLAGGADVVMDCVGSASSLEDALAVVRPRGRVVLVGMPGRARVDLAPLWQREVTLVGTYAYGREERGGTRPRTFELAFELVGAAGLGRLVSARYPLERYREAIAHAAAAGSRGGVKVVFDLSAGGRRPGRRTP